MTDKVEKYAAILARTSGCPQDQIAAELEALTKAGYTPIGIAVSQWIQSRKSLVHV